MFNKKQTRKYQLKHSKTARKQFNNVKHKYSSTVKKMRGGSPQSNIVMSETSMRPMSDYVTSPRIRVKGYDNSLSSVLSSQRPQMGGSPASDLVMANLTNTPNTNNKSMFNESLVKGDINSLKLYNTTGGMVNIMATTDGNPCNCTCGKCSNKHNNNKTGKTGKSSKNCKCDCKKCNCNCMCKHCNTNQSKRTTKLQSGGVSDWMSSQYSLGNINSANSGLSGNFTSQGIPSRNELMNPSSMGLAGSGFPMSSLEGANVSRNGAPF